MSESRTSPLLEVDQVGKSYDGVLALAPVAFRLDPGEILGLVGENGAGKSTLIKLLSGAERTDSGEMRIDGTPVSFHEPSEAAAAGIVTVYQEFSLFPTLTVAENLLFGQFPTRGGVISWPRIWARASSFLKEVGLHVDPRERVDRLSVAEKQMLEIARALHRDARVIILDEPTAVLGGEDVDTLLGIVRDLSKRGIAIIMVSHRLSEILSVCDNYLVLKDGHAVASGAIADTSHDDLVSKMVGRDLSQTTVREFGTPSAGPELLRVENLSSPGKLNELSLTVRSGEIVGLAGLRGAGRTELLEALFGIDPKSHGTIHLNGKKLALRGASDAIAAGMGLVPEERALQGVFLDMSVADNVPIARMAAKREWFTRRRSDLALASSYQKKLRIRAASLRQRVRGLSGGNQQKVVFAKWIETDVQLLLLDEPTRGVDIGAKFEIYELIEKLRADGRGILIASSELPELLLVCDRVLVMHQGSLVGVLAHDELTEEAILNLAVGGAHPTAAISNVERQESTDVV